MTVTAQRIHEANGASHYSFSDGQFVSAEECIFTSEATWPIGYQPDLRNPSSVSICNVDAVWRRVGGFRFDDALVVVLNNENIWTFKEGMATLLSEVSGTPGIRVVVFPHSEMAIFAIVEENK